MNPNDLKLEIRARPPGAARELTGQLGSTSDFATDDGDRETFETLRLAQEVLMRFPMAAQAAFNVLVAEGREYARTPEGAELFSRLAHGNQANRLRVIWEILTLSGITEQKSSAIPSVFLDRLARTLLVEKLEPMLARLFERER